MAELVTVQSIITRALRRADLENSLFIGVDEQLDMANEAYASLYNLLVDSYENYFSTEVTIALSIGVDTYSLPADFYKAIAFDFDINGRRQTLFPYTELERNATLFDAASIPSGTVYLRYIPRPTLFTDVTQTIDGISGWEALLVTDMAIMMLDKEEADTDRLQKRWQRDYERIQALSHNRSVTFPGRVTDVTLQDMSFIRETLRWRLYGNNVQFVTAQFLGFT